LSKTWRDDVADNPSGLRIRDPAFHSVADLNPHPSIRDRHDNEKAIVLVAFTDAPLLKQPDRCLFDRPPPERGQDGDRNLRRRFPRVCLQTFF
jgi:hypothetical protein